MTEAYPTFASFILFKEVDSDELGHLYRAGEFARDGIRRTVWLRVFDGAAAPVQELRAALPTSREIAKTLRATNVVADPVFVDADGVPAVGWTHVPAQPLSRLFGRVREEGFPVPVDNALLILEKLSLALSAGLAVEVGGQSLTHGFLHPGLILVSNDGEALVSGFGLGDALLGVLDDPQAAASFQPYLAPEVITSRTPSKRGDVYSLGAILYQLLTGQPPAADPARRGGDLEQAQLAYEDQPLPEDIKGLLRRALAERAEERFSSAADFKKELDRLLYGGAYSPTTFNLALFMDRLFRSDIEAEETERAAEAAVDVGPYLRPEPAVVEAPEEGAPAPRKGGAMVWLGIAAVVVVAVAVAAVLLMRPGATGPAAVPTPSAEQLAAERAAQEEKLKQLAAQMVAEQMAEKEAEIRAELKDRQQRIEDLQRQLAQSQQRAERRELTAEEQQQQAALQKKLAAEEEARRTREAELEAERQRREADAREKLAAQQAAATATAAAEEAQQAAEEAPTAPPTRVAQAQQPTPGPDAAPQEKARPAGTSSASDVEPVEAGAFYDPTEVDSLPTVLREAEVSWPRVAARSRREGMVIVQALVDADGRVEDVRVLRADDEEFGITDAVLDAVRRYQFRPATKDGVEVKTYATVTRRYRFRDR